MIIISKRGREIAAPPKREEMNIPSAGAEDKTRKMGRGGRKSSKLVIYIYIYIIFIFLYLFI